MSQEDHLGGGEGPTGALAAVESRRRHGRAGKGKRRCH